MSASGKTGVQAKTTLRWKPISRQWSISTRLAEGIAAPPRSAPGKASPKSASLSSECVKGVWGFLLKVSVLGLRVILELACDFVVRGTGLSKDGVVHGDELHVG